MLSGVAPFLQHYRMHGTDLKASCRSSLPSTPSYRRNACGFSSKASRSPVIRSAFRGAFIAQWENAFPQESMGRGFEPIGAHGLAAGLWIPATGCTRILMPVPNAKEPNWPVARPVARPCIKSWGVIAEPTAHAIDFCGNAFSIVL